MTSPRSQSAMVSLSVHMAAITMLLLLSKQISPVLPRDISIHPADLISPYVPKRVVSVSTSSSSGGGGAQQRLPATAGHLPKMARQFVPPAVEIVNPHPKLAMEMSIEAPPDLPDRNLPGLGDPLSQFVNGSGGVGGPLGIGNSKGTGIGNKGGPGAGDGNSPSAAVYRAGNGVTMPVLIHRVEPEFSEEARKAKHSGTVLLHVDVDAAGRARNIRVVQSLGMGLDEKAVEAVVQWLFRPGTKDGRPVAVSAVVEVRFQLL